MSSSDSDCSPTSSPPPLPASLLKKRTQTLSISPPPLKRKRLPGSSSQASTSTPTTPHPTIPSHLSTSAAIEAGRVQITDHLSHFTALLASHIHAPFPPLLPQLSIPSYADLYTSSSHNPNGAHFVVHQHDHPIAGVHYDLRLQTNGTSSASWAIMKGLPGDANSTRLGRNATETRVHCLWNHLIETGSRETGSLLVWDMGTYEVLPGREEEERVRRSRAVETESEGESQSREQVAAGRERGERGGMTEQEKLAGAFKERKIRLRLHGTRLPRGYTVHMRLSVEDDLEGRAKAAKVAKFGVKKRSRRFWRRDADAPETSGSEEEEYNDGASTMMGDYESRVGEAEDGLSAMEREIREMEDVMVRNTNAYPGADNTIGSVHQRRWFLSLDRAGSGFVKQREKGRVTWVRDVDRPPEKQEDKNRWTYPFYIRGSEHERSIVTGRLGDEILRDEGVTDFVHRKGWRPILN
ncbi:ABC1 domain-containing protein [Coniochaeta sp. 2T2.1]|nr:ABC1 domain-containing protein [Coniochaeta sp. 2T2.1]